MAHMLHLIWGTSTLDTSGIVIAGFGELDYFPKLEAHKHYGMVLGRTLCSCEKSLEISHNNASEVLPLAQSEMARTFLDGTSDSVLKEIEAAHTFSLAKLETDLKATGVIEPETNIEGTVMAATEAFSTALVDKLIESHTAPMKRVVVPPRW